MMATKKRPRPASSGGGAVSDNHQRVASKVEAMGDDSSPTLDWIAALASKASSSSSARAASGRGASAAGQQAAVTTKEERIERRSLKKKRRQLQKEVEKERKNEKQRAKKELTTQSHRAAQDTDPIRRRPVAAGAAASTTTADRRRDHNRTSMVSRERLERLASALHERSLATGTADSFRHDHRRPPAVRACQPHASSPSSHPPPAPFKKRRWEQSSLQPRKRDYGGIGLARPTLYLELDDPSFGPKLEEEFREHVPGFYGRSVFHNSQKRRSSQASLWRTLPDRAKASGIKVDGKRLSDLSPDERVEAMLRAGLI